MNTRIGKLKARAARALRRFKRYPTEQGDSFRLDAERIKAVASPSNDRSDPLSFAGRRKELEWLHGLYSLATYGGKGLSCVIQDIPGSGKTALASEFCRQAEDRGGIAVKFDAREFVRSDSVAARILERVNALAAQDLGRDLPKIRKDTAIKLNVPGIVSYQQAVLQMDAGRLLAENMSIVGIPRDIPVVCFVDEAHRLPNEAESLVAQLHTGVNGRMMLPVYAGIAPRVKARLEEMSGSIRLASDSARSLGPLDPQAVEASIAIACRRLGLTADDASLIANRMAPETHQFAAYVTAAVGAVAQTIVNRGNVRFTDAALDTCVAVARERRETYYEARLESAGNPPIAVLAVLADAVVADDEWTEYGPLRDKWNAAAKQWAARNQRSAPGLDETMAACERAGVVRLRSRDDVPMFQFPAPSMVRHIKSKAQAITRSRPCPAS